MYRTSLFKNCLHFSLRAFLYLTRECNEVLPRQWNLGEVHQLRCLRPPARPRIRAGVRGHRGAAHHYLLHWIHPQPSIALAGADCFRLLQVSVPTPAPSLVTPIPRVWHLFLPNPRLTPRSLYLSLFTRELRCLRNTIHANLFFTYIMSALFWILLLSVQVSIMRLPDNCNCWLIKSYSCLKGVLVQSERKL